MKKRQSLVGICRFNITFFSALKIIYPYASKVLFRLTLRDDQVEDYTDQGR